MTSALNRLHNNAPEETLPYAAEGTRSRPRQKHAAKQRQPGPGDTRRDSLLCPHSLWDFACRPDPHQGQRGCSCAYRGGLHLRQYWTNTGLRAHRDCTFDNWAFCVGLSTPSHPAPPVKLPLLLTPDLHSGHRGHPGPHPWTQDSPNSAMLVLIWGSPKGPREHHRGVHSCGGPWARSGRNNPRKAVVTPLLFQVLPALHLSRSSTRL